MELPRTGIFAVYKPKGPTSHDMISALRALLGMRTIGHAGTLDPYAEGVLVVGVGRDATKQLASPLYHEKEYVAQVYFGITSETDDAEGPLHTHSVDHIPLYEDIEQSVVSFIGKIDQIPPRYSAVKLEGKKSYKEARKGRALDIKPRSVEIKEIEILSYTWPLMSIRVVTGPGVYIRALARDMGERLGIGAYLFSLIRTRVGKFIVGDAYRIPLRMLE